MTRAVRLLLPALSALAALQAIASCGGRTLGAIAGTEDGGSTGGGAGALATGGEGNFPATGGGISGGSGGSASWPSDLPERTRLLADLDLEELRAVCREDTRRTDACIREGMESSDEALCEAAAAECRSQNRQGEALVGCDRLRDLSDCPVSVEQYFECVDAWNLTQTCDNAGRLIEKPEPCEPVSECEDFRYAFEQFGRPARCRPDEIVEEPHDTNDDIYGLDGCYPVPARLVALGNSVAHCEGGVNGDGCAAAMLAHYLRENYAPELEYEMRAALGAPGVLSELANQANDVEGGPGHVAVWIYAFPTDDPHSLDFDLWRTQIAAVLDYFTDASRFPDGATFLINTQYSPTDQCWDGPTFIGAPLTEDDEGILRQINQTLFIDLALERPDTVSVDQYPDWLGHGWYAGVSGCPHCQVDDTPWQGDPVHPNEDGQRHIFDKWRVAVDRMYACEQ